MANAISGTITVKIVVPGLSKGAGGGGGIPNIGQQVAKQVSQVQQGIKNAGIKNFIPSGGTLQQKLQMPANAYPLLPKQITQFAGVSTQAGAKKESREEAKAAIQQQKEQDVMSQRFIKLQKAMDKGKEIRELQQMKNEAVIANRIQNKNGLFNSKGMAAAAKFLPLLGGAAGLIAIAKSSKLLSQTSSAMAEMLSALVDVILAPLMPLLLPLLKALAVLIKNTAEFLQDPAAYLAKIWENFVKWLTGKFGDAKEAILNFFSEIPGKVISFFETAPGKIIEFFKGIDDKILNFFKEAPGKIANEFNIKFKEVILAILKLIPGDQGESKLKEELDKLKGIQNLQITGIISKAEKEQISTEDVIKKAIELSSLWPNNPMKIIDFYQKLSDRKEKEINVTNHINIQIPGIVGEGILTPEELGRRIGNSIEEELYAADRSGS